MRCLFRCPLFYVCSPKPNLPSHHTTRSHTSRHHKSNPLRTSGSSISLQVAHLSQSLTSSTTKSPSTHEVSKLLWDVAVTNLPAHRPWTGIADSGAHTWVPNRITSQCPWEPYVYSSVDRTAPHNFGTQKRVISFCVKQSKYDPVLRCCPCLIRALSRSCASAPSWS